MTQRTCYVPPPVPTVPIAMAAMVASMAPIPLPPAPALPEPTPITRELRPERGRTPGYFLHTRQDPRIGGRLGLGVVGFLGPPVPVRAGFALDVVLAGRVPASRRQPRFTLFPELGYNLAAGAKHTRGHLFTAGLGLGGTDRGIGVALIPRLVTGSLLGQRALGVRSGLLVEVIKVGGVGFTLDHQALLVAGEWSHSVIFTVFVGIYGPGER